MDQPVKQAVDFGVISNTCNFRSEGEKRTMKQNLMCNFSKTRTSQ